MYDNVVLIPYRNRKNHLDYFINNTVPLFEKWLPNTKVVVVEQTAGKLFNRGVVLNVGFKEYQNKTKYFITHDVDCNPDETVVRDIYSCNNIEILRIKSPHKSSLGGITKMSHGAIFNINGFPNYIWGWGIEDRALYYRCIIKNITITENNKKNFKIMPHKSNAETYIDEKKKISDMWCKDNISKLDENAKEKLIMDSGLNNLKYDVIKKISLHPCVELILVDI